MDRLGTIGLGTPLARTGSGVQVTPVWSWPPARSGANLPDAHAAPLAGAWR